jgi:protein tyrosine phosphatase type 4A
MDAPRQSNLHLYIREMKRYNVTDLVRVCECTYEGADLRNAGILLHEMAYDDGTSPPKEIISQWLELVRSRFYSKTGKAISIVRQWNRWVA